MAGFFAKNGCAGFCKRTFDRSERVHCPVESFLKPQIIFQLPAQAGCAAGVMLPSFLSRLRCGGLLGCDLVLEVVWVQAVEAAFGGFGLRIHKEADWPAVRSRQGYVMREVICHPVHFPGAE